MVGPGLVLRQGHLRGGGRGDLLGQVQAWLILGWCSGKVTQGEGGGEIYWDRYRYGWSRVGAQARSPKGRREGGSTGTGTGMVGPGLVLRQGHPRGGGRGDLLGQVQVWLVQG